MERVETQQAPAAIGPYSQGMVANGFLFTAGQIPIDPATGKFTGHSIVEQTEQVLKNLAAILATRGATWRDVVKTTVYLHDMAEFTSMNEVYARVLGDARPARSTVQVAGLPRDAKIEIDAVIALPMK